MKEAKNGNSPQRRIRHPDSAGSGRQGAVGGIEDLRGVDVLVAGNGGRAAAGAAAKLGGVRKVLLAEAAELEYRLAEPLAATIVSLAGGYDTIIAPATISGKNVMPRVAALLDVMQLSEIIEVVTPDTFKRPIYPGNAIQTAQSTGAKRVIQRTASFQAASEGGSAPIETVSAAAKPRLTAFVENKLSGRERPELASAKIIISGAARWARRRNSGNILPVTDKLGAADATSRAALDAGYAPNEWQVGQTARWSPRPLHRLRRIRRHPASCRQDGFEGHCRLQQGREAPIFQVADYVLIGDFFLTLPELEKAI
ncbi:FAD-binding protein [Mesorhizobium sp. M0129]